MPKVALRSVVTGETDGSTPPRAWRVTPSTWVDVATARFGPDVARPSPKAIPPMHPLDNPVWGALHGPQREVAESDGLAARYLPEVSPFGAFPEPPGPEHWDGDGASSSAPAAWSS